MTEKNQRRVNPGVETSKRSGERSRNMTATSTGRIIAPSLALVAACGAALVFGITHVRREPPVSTRDTTAAPAASPAASGVRDEGSAALSTAQAKANALAAELAVSPSSPVTDERVPVFDVARVERTGEAVIAGRAAPGAIVELLRNGDRHDQAVASPSGQFVMVPPRLPPGDYELTLRSRSSDGTLATSKQSVAVALDEVESNSGPAQSQAEVPLNVPETAVANRLWQDHAGSLLKRASSPSLLCILRNGRTLLSCCTRLPPPLYQMAAHRPPWSGPRLRPRSYPVATACGASAMSPTARARDSRSFTERTETRSEIQIVFCPARFLSFQ
jgi:hypothetical protein